MLKQSSIFVKFKIYEVYKELIINKNGNCSQNIEIGN